MRQLVTQLKISMLTPLVTAHVNKIVFEELPQFSQPYIRGFTMLGDATAINVLNNAPGLMHGYISPQTIARCGQSLVQLDEPNNVQMLLPIDTKHASVLIELILIFTNDVCCMYRLRGFTDRSQFSLSTGIPDGDTFIYINNVEEMRLTSGYTPLSLMSARQVYYIPTAMPKPNAIINSVRAQDVLTNAFVDATGGNVIQTHHFDDVPNNTIISRLTVAPSSEVVAKCNSYTWMSSILNTYLSGATDVQYGVNSSSAIGMAYDAAAIDWLTKNDVIRALVHKLKPGSTSGDISWFQFKELYTLDSTLAGDYNRIILAKNGNVSTETANLDMSGVEATIAQLMATQIRSVMYASNIAAVSFTITSMTLDKNTVMQFNDRVIPLVNTTPELQATQAEQFSEHVKNVLFPTLTRGIVEITVTVSSSHSGPTVVIVAVDGSVSKLNPIRFTFPSHMDNTFSPMLSIRSSADIGASATETFRKLDSLRNMNITTQGFNNDGRYGNIPAIVPPPQPQQVPLNPSWTSAAPIQTQTTVTKKNGSFS